MTLDLAAEVNGEGLSLEVLSLFFRGTPCVFEERPFLPQYRPVVSTHLSDAWFQFPVTGPRLLLAFSILQLAVLVLLSDVQLQFVSPLLLVTLGPGTYFWPCRTRARSLTALLVVDFLASV